MPTASRGLPRDGKSPRIVFAAPVDCGSDAHSAIDLLIAFLLLAAFSFTLRRRSAIRCER
jgi:hypothetical protein